VLNEKISKESVWRKSATTYARYCVVVSVETDPVVVVVIRLHGVNLGGTSSYSARGAYDGIILVDVGATISSVVVVVVVVVVEVVVVTKVCISSY
jgi:hypothetical protein